MVQTKLCLKCGDNSTNIYFFRAGKDENIFVMDQFEGHLCRNCLRKGKLKKLVFFIPLLIIVILLSIDIFVNILEDPFIPILQVLFFVILGGYYRSTSHPSFTTNEMIIGSEIIMELMTKDLIEDGYVSFMTDDGSYSKWIEDVKNKTNSY